MNDDDRLSRYLSDRAEGITLGPADPSAVMRRGSRRRLRRRSAIVGGVAVVGLLATTVVVRSGSDERVKVSVASPDVTASTYQWSVVKPTSGLGYSGSRATLANGAVYGLSTAPGPIDPNKPSTPPVLYRSDDGTEWAKVALPAGLSAASLGSAGNTLYALGTTPAGGKGEVVVAASTDGAASWTSVQLPSDVSDLIARHPGEVSMGQPTFAAKDATHQVASVVVSANLDLAKYKPDVTKANDVTWQWTDTGVTVYRSAPPCSVPAGGDAATMRDIAKKCGQHATPTTITVDANGNGPVVATYTWKDLGIDPELQGLVNGRTYAYVTDDGAHFTAATLPGDASGWGSRVLADASGYEMFLGHSAPKSSTTDVLHSVDGHTWALTTSLPGSAMDAGLLGGRPAVSLADDDGHSTVRAEQADGTWPVADLSQAVPAGPAGSNTYVGDVAFGPLGLAATVVTYDGKDAGTSTAYVVHSPDGSHLSVLPVSDKVHDKVVPIGIDVSADAITVRLGQAPTGDPNTTPTQTVLVGTPTG